MNIWNLFTTKEKEPQITDHFLSKIAEIELKHNELENKYKKMEQYNQKLTQRIKKLEDKIKNLEKHDFQILDVIDRTSKVEDIVKEHIQYNIYYRNIINDLLQKKLV